jgi:hypothetical protein
MLKKAGGKFKRLSTKRVQSSSVVMLGEGLEVGSLENIFRRTS